MSNEQGIRRWLNPYHPKMLGRLGWIVIRSAPVVIGVSIAYFWAVENWGFEATVTFAVWFLLMAEFMGPNPYLFRKWVHRALRADQRGQS